MLTTPSLYAFDHQHRALARLLETAVVPAGASTQVDYGWLQDHSGPLEEYLSQLEQVPANEFKQWSRPQQLAFLINAYNAYTLQLILSDYPEVASIRDLGGWFSSPWEQERFLLLGEIKTLGAIEHQWLRARYSEPRIHFAIVCASVGCPALSKEPYQATHLEQQLEAAKRKFLGDVSRNRYDPLQDRLYLSKIFDWFAQDFEQSAGSVAAYVADSLGHNDAERKHLISGAVDIHYFDYDWSLNQKP
ncbi:MAG: DUF547 domain-containing protein [bacterium]|nr:DUF547 domain-containing protein [bacterium]